MARTYNESKAVFLAGPIEYWWDTPKEPDRFNGIEAQRYRLHREAVARYFVDRHYLVYSPWNAFKGDWNEKMQPVNDFVLGLSDIVVDLTPKHIKGMVAKGTDHEIKLARELGKVVVELPPNTRKVKNWRGSYEYDNETFTPAIVEMKLETARILNGW
jgi:hypothetical protein